MPPSHGDSAPSPPAAEFVSERIDPDAGTFDATAMARGEPGMPGGFTWRDRHYVIVELLASWKECEREGHRAGGESYYRKHYYRVRADDGRIMTLYVTRQVKSGENQRRRWWIYSIESAGAKSS